MSSAVRRTSRIVLAAVSAAGMLAVAACGGGSGSGSEQSQAEGPDFSQRGPINFVSGKDTSNAVPQIIEKWNAAHPDEKVTFVELSDSADQQRASMIQNAQTKGEDYTVLDTDVVWMSEFAANGWIDPLPKEQFPTDTMLKSAVDGATYFNKLYALPVTSDGALLYFRKDWLEAAGVQAPKTWDEMKAACEAVKAKVPEAAQADCYAGQQQKYEGLTVNVAEAINSAGGTVVEGDKVGVNSPEAVEGLKWMADSVADGTIPKAAITWKEEESRTAFQEGKLIFLRNWPYVYSKFSSNDGSSKVNGKFEVAPIPGKDGAGVSSLGGHNYAISKFAKNKGTALDFMKFASDPEQQKQRTITSALAPTVESLYDDPELVKEYPYLPVLKESIATAKPRPKVVKYGDVTLAIQDASYAVLQGQKEPQAAMDELQPKLEELTKNN